MSDTPDNPFIWDAWKNGPLDQNDKPDWSSPFHKISDVDFEMIKWFNLEPKGYGAPQIQPHAFRVMLPSKDKADFRIIYRMIRKKALNGVNTSFPDNMMPANIILGAEKLTVENEQSLKAFERGEPFNGNNGLFPLSNGFRLNISPDMSFLCAGKVSIFTSLEAELLVTYLKVI